MTKSNIEVQSNRIKLALTSLRPHYEPGTPDLEILSMVLQNGNGDLTPESLEAYAKKKKAFSTADVMQHFQVGKYKVAGSLASLTRQGKIKLAEKKTDANGYSQYVWVKALRPNQNTNDPPPAS
jgi:hypothetical protein